MMFKSIDIWNKISNEKIIVYRCFQTIPDNKYFIQSQDYYYMDGNTGLIKREQIEYFQNQFLERIFELEAENIDYFNSLEEAIEKFELD
ncbi:MAG: hypothetical protein H7263_12835 [Candidatus Sericytochromatia bacterium]|nr:hypothetical protein [Candidatus Sericytochromatia bacterium]